jgi:nucleotide-binding universal stress UspA family protein
MLDMFSNILVSVIGSAQCERVLNLAVNICKPSSIINIVCVLDSSHSGCGDFECGEDTTVTDLQSANSLISNFCTWVTCKGFQSVGKVLNGDIVSELSRHATSLGSEIIVMGHQHMTLLERWFGVSLTADMLEAAPCPVLVEVR